MGLSRTQFKALPEVEQIDWLALELLRENQLEVLMKSMEDAIKNKKPIDGGAYMSLILEGID